MSDNLDYTPRLQQKRSGKERRDPDPNSDFPAIRTHIHDGLAYGAYNGHSCSGCGEIQLFRKRDVVDRRCAQAAKLKAEEPIPFYTQEGVCLLHANPYCEKCNVRSGRERRGSLGFYAQGVGIAARGGPRGGSRNSSAGRRCSPTLDFIGDGPGEPKKVPTAPSLGRIAEIREWAAARWARPEIEAHGFKAACDLLAALDASEARRIAAEQALAIVEAENARLLAKFEGWRVQIEIATDSMLEI